MVFGWRSFEVYPLQVRVAGAVPVLPLREHTFDLDAMLAAVTERTRLIFVCNPNNPTSTVVEPDELGRFRGGRPAGDSGGDRRGLRRVHPRRYCRIAWLCPTIRNVVVLRTFSKAYGLAGLRVGYAVGDPEVITALGKVYVPFTSSTISLLPRSPRCWRADELLARTDAVVAERRRVSDELVRLGYTLLLSQANFVWLPLAPTPWTSPGTPPRPGCWCGRTATRGPG